MTPSLTDLLLESRQLGFLGPGPVEEHLDHARAFTVFADKAPSAALDLGAGGGLPGLVLAVEEWPETQWVFLDSHQRRTDFLDEAVVRLGLQDRVRVVRERAEVAGQAPEFRSRFDLVVSRSFGPPSVTAECAAGFLQVGGHLVVSEPPETDSDERWPADGVEVLGLGRPMAVTTEGVRPVHLVQIQQVSATPERYPRRTGVPSKRPLF